MIHYEGSAFNQYDSEGSGNAYAGATVTVRDAFTGAKAALYSDNGATETTNPVTAGNDGAFDFWVVAGDYNLVFNEGVSGREKTQRNVFIFDGNGTILDTEADLKASTVPVGATVYCQELGYGQFKIYGIGTTVEDGDVLMSNGFVAKAEPEAQVVTSAQFGITGSGDETDKIQRMLNKAKNNVIVLDPDKTYNYTSLTIPSGVTMFTNTAVFNRLSASTTHGITIEGNVTIDRLIINTPGGTGGDKGVLITGSNVTIDRFACYAAASGSTSSVNYGLEIDDGGSGFVNNIAIGSMRLERFTTGIFGKRITNLQLGFFRSTFARTAAYFRDLQDSDLRGAYIDGLSPTLIGAAGENALLIESTSDEFSRNINVENWYAKDTGEHGFRLGGQATIRDVFYENCTSERPGRSAAIGGAGFKALGATSRVARHENIHYINCTVIDAGLTGGVNNFSAFNLFACNDVYLVNPTVKRNQQIYSCLQAVIFGTINNLQISNPSFKDCQNQVIKPHDEDGSLVGNSGPSIDIYIKGGNLHRATNTGPVIAMQQLNFTGHKNWHFDTTMAGGNSAFRVEAGEPGTINGVNTLKGNYVDSGVDDSTATTQIINGENVMLCSLVANWRPSASGPEANNASYIQSPSDGNMYLRKAGIWSAL